MTNQNSNRTTYSTVLHGKLFHATAFLMQVVQVSWDEFCGYPTGPGSQGSCVVNGVNIVFLGDGKSMVLLDGFARISPSSASISTFGLLPTYCAASVYPISIRTGCYVDSALPETGKNPAALLLSQTRLHNQTNRKRQAANGFTKVNAHLLSSSAPSGLGLMSKWPQRTEWRGKARWTGLQSRLTNLPSVLKV